MNPESTARAREVIRLNDSIYQLYRPSEPRSMQVVFFHGFQLEGYESAHTKTWTLGDGSVWPQTWLVDEFPEAHVLSVSYNGWVTTARHGGTMDLFNICENLMENLLSANRNESRCPIILVGHSFGGLVVKELCVHVSNRKGCQRDSKTESSLEDFLNDVRGIFFYATPHHGISEKALALLTVENQSLSEYVTTLSTPAARAEFNFFPLSEKYKWRIVGLGESHPIKKTRFLAQLVGEQDIRVTLEASSRYGLSFNIAENTNHITITRPTERTQRNFRALVDLLNAIKQKDVELERPVHQSQGIPKSHAGLARSSRECGIPTEFQPAAKRRCIVATVNNIDDLYVPINKPHSAVIEAIEDRQGCSVILLHGGVGKGKSTLARSMIQRYGIQKDTTDGRAFDNVVWVSCGNCSRDEISTKQLEILQDYSPNSLGDSPVQEETNPRQRIAKALQQFFGDNKVLMILDDVSDVSFLIGMWAAATGGKASAGGKGVKILVTSQWENICAKAGLKDDSCDIFMEAPMEDEAMKILASLVGLEGKYIPCHLQPTAKEMVKVAARNPLALACLASHLSFNQHPTAKDMIKVTERNPLALACLASQFIYSKDIEDQQAWQDALKGLRKLLNSPEGKLVLPVTEPGKHDDPRSLYVSMKICIDSLETDDAQTILIFMYAFKEESVPELVLRILHGNLKRSNCTFSKSKDELRMRELLKVHQEPRQPPSLSLRSLVKLYMEHTKMVGDNEIKSLIDEFLHGIEQAPESSSAEIKQGDETDRVKWEKARVAITLCALYFNQHNSSINKILAEAMTRANVTYSNDDINDLRQKAIYPILSLMDEPKNEHWKESDVSSARQVFLTYICKRKLDNENISHLLELAACTAAQLATLKAVYQILTIEKEPLLKDNNFTFLHPLVHLLDVNRGLPTSLLEEASKTLFRLCHIAAREKSTYLVTNMPSILDMLVNLLSFPTQCPNVVAESAARALTALSSYCGFGKTTHFAILEKEGALINLAKCLSEHGNPGLQRQAAVALASLVVYGDTSIQLRIVNQEGVLQSLVKLISSNETPATLQGIVTCAVQVLARTKDDFLKSRIANHEGVLQNLVKLMSSNETLAYVRVQATQALRNLACATDNALKSRIVNEEGALEGLVKLLSMHDKPKIQEQAAATLQNLIFKANSSLKVRIANHEGVLHNLVKLMSSNEALADVRVQATWALRNLASVEDNALKSRIVNEEGALEGLVKLLSMHDKPEIQEGAVATLGNLACNANSSLKVCIGNHEGVLQNLVKLMSSNETLADVRVQATRALQNLAYAADNVLKSRIVNEEGALEGLVKLLSDDNPNTQKHATIALGNLACNANSSLKVCIGNHEGVLQNLVKLMSSNETLADVRVQATWALQNLASAEDNALKSRIVNEEGAVEGLVKLLSMHDKPEIQEDAAATLGNLIFKANSSLKVRIANHEGVLQNLVKLMSSNEALADVRVQATWALRNLASVEDNALKSRIVNEEGALEGLVKLLSMHNKPEAQKQAAAVLINLSCNEDSSLMVHIANHEGVLQNLVKLMSSNETLADVRVQATWALQNLASAEDNALKSRIVNEEGAVEGLVKLLSMHDKPEIQEDAAATLGNLIFKANSSLKVRIANHEGVLQNLVKLMSSNETLADVQVQATQALRNLACATDNALKSRIVNEEGALEGLVKLLSMHDKPKTQEQAAATLQNLIFKANSSLKVRIANHEGVLQNLVKLMSSNEALADVRVQATRALRNLARARDNALKSRIVNEEGAVEGLVKLLSMHNKPEAQEHAAAVLGDLACYADRSLKRRIANHEQVLDSLGKLKSSRETPANVRAQATRALRNLASPKIGFSSY